MRQNLAVESTSFRFMDAADKTLTNHQIWWKKDGAEWEEMEWVTLLKPTERYKSYSSVIFKDRDNFRRLLSKLVDKHLYGGSN